MNLKYVIELSKKREIFACLNSSYIYIINERQKTSYRVQSQEQIVYLGKGYKDATFIIINATHNWIIYELTHNQPIPIKIGVIVHNIEEQIINVSYIDQKILFVMDNYAIYEGNIHAVNGQTKKIQQNKQQSTQVHNFLLYSLLPNTSNSKLIDLTIINNILYYVIKTNSEDIYSIYTSYWTKQGLISGKQCIIGIKERPFGIYQISNKDLIIVTSNVLYHWTQNMITNYKQYHFKGTINLNNNTYYACCTNSNTNAYIVLQISMLNHKLKFTETTPKNFNKSIIQVFKTSSGKLYGLTSKHQFINLDAPQNYLVRNLLTTIIKAELTASNLSNLVYVNKKIGQNQQKLLVTSQMIVTDIKMYKHNIILNYSEVLYVKSNRIVLSSPLIATLCLDFQLKNNIIEFLVPKSHPFSQQSESLFISDEYQITNSHIYNLKSQRQKSKKTLENQGKCSFKQIPELFENVCEFINHAIIVNNLIIIGINEQLHIFQVQGFKRLHIHCFESQIIGLCGINDVNVIGCQTVDSIQMQIYVLNEENKLQMRKCVNIQNSKIYRFKTVINTMSYCLNLTIGKLIVCSNENLHRYQPSKINIQVYQLIGWPQKCKKICPIINSDSQNVNNQFLLYGFDQTQIVTFSNKYLVKTVDEISLSYQQILALNIYNTSDINILFIVRKSVNLIIVDTSYINILNLNSNYKLKVENGSYLSKYLYGKQANNLNILNYQQLNLSEQPKIIQLYSTHHILLFTRFQLWYGSMTYVASNSVNIKLLSYFGMSNQEFIGFRNNLSISQINDPSFMKLFSHKLEIVDVKYIANDAIIVLFDNMIVVLQIGYNDALTVRQQLKFNKIDNNIKIIELLDSYNMRSIYVKDNQSRLYILKELQNNQRPYFQLIFQENLEDDVICVGRVNQWENKSRVFSLKEKINKKYQKLVIKKDGQISIGNNSKIVYL